MVGTLTTGVLLIVLGIVLAGLGVHQLGVVRAALKWPAARQPRVGRGLAGAEVTAGILATAAGGVVLTTLLAAAPTVRLGAAIGAVVLTGVLGVLLAAKVADRVELNTLIRSPSPLYRTTTPRPGGHHQTATDTQRKTTPPPPEPDTSQVLDPGVPADAQPGWVCTDTAGCWYLCVATGSGARLVRLPDFWLAAPDASRHLTVAGTVELSVWPLTGDDSADAVGSGVRHPST